MNRFHPLAMGPDTALERGAARFLAPLRTALSDNGRSIAIDVSLRDGVYQVWADLPGIERLAVVVSVDGNTVRIDAIRVSGTGRSAEHRVVSSAPQGDLEGALSRCFALPSALDEGRASALFGRGVLIVELPLLEPLPVPLSIRAPMRDSCLSARNPSSRWNGIARLIRPERDEDAADVR